MTYQLTTKWKQGEVVLIFYDNPLSKIGVRFNKSLPNGVDLGGACEGGIRFFCNVADFHFVHERCQKVCCGKWRSRGPYSFKSKLEKLPDNVVVIGSNTPTDS